MNTAALYRTLWRWHFYAGLLVLPFVLVLSLSGAVFLFKPQVERWEERAFQNQPTTNPATPSQQVTAALNAFPGARFHSYRLPERTGDSAMVHLELADHRTMRDVFVAPQGAMLGSLNPTTRIIEVMQRIHGQLLLGPRGSWLVELAASWAIVMIVTGLFLWWPRGRGVAGVLWPRRRSLLRDLHSVTGFWVAGFALVLLLSGLPWADVWGSMFKALRTEMGWVQSTQDWTIGGRTPDSLDEHASHDHDAMQAGRSIFPTATALDHLVAIATAEKLPFPAVVTPPAATRPGTEMPSTLWTVKSETQNRPLRVSITYDAATGTELRRERFADRHPIDRVVGYGIAWHEGQLFGVANQIIGVITALALMAMSVTGFLMWRRRRPPGTLGAPALPRDQGRPLVVSIATLLLAAVLPLLAASLLLLWGIDRLLPRLCPAAAVWLGISRRDAAA